MRRTTVSTCIVASKIKKLQDIVIKLKIIALNCTCGFPTSRHKPPLFLHINFARYSYGRYFANSSPSSYTFVPGAISVGEIPSCSPNNPSCIPCYQFGITTVHRRPSSHHCHAGSDPAITRSAFLFAGSPTASTIRNCLPDM